MNYTIEQNYSCMNYDPFTISHKHRKLSNVMVGVDDSKASNLGSIFDQVSDFFCKIYFVEFISLEEKYGEICTLINIEKLINLLPPYNHLNFWRFMKR